MHEEFKEGQQVCVVDVRGVPVKLLTVTKILKRKAVLSDNSEWHLNGDQPYGRRDTYYRGPHIRSVRPTDDEQIRTRNLAGWLGKVPWGELPLETLREVHRIVRPMMVEKGLIKPAAPDTK